MSLSRWLTSTAAVCLFLNAGCASAPAVYGERARFSPAFQGYVMAANDGSDDPGKDDTVLLLRDPVSGEKLRCREHVLEWRELHEDLAVDEIQDHRAAIAAGRHDVGDLRAGRRAPAAGRASRSWRARGRPRPSTISCARRAPPIWSRPERACTTASGTRSRAFASSTRSRRTAPSGWGRRRSTFLGLSYMEQGKRDRAAKALTAFLDRAAVRDVDGYREAEAALKALGAPREGVRLDGACRAPLVGARHPELRRFFQEPDQRVEARIREVAGDRAVRIRPHPEAVGARVALPLVEEAHPKVPGPRAAALEEDAADGAEEEARGAGADHRRDEARGRGRCGHGGSARRIRYPARPERKRCRP
jgi:hypothetical protein